MNFWWNLAIGGISSSVSDRQTAVTRQLISCSNFWRLKCDSADWAGDVLFLIFLFTHWLWFSRSSMLHNGEALWPHVTSRKRLCQWDVTWDSHTSHAVLWDMRGPDKPRQSEGLVCVWRNVTTHQKLVCCCTAGCLREVLQHTQQKCPADSNLPSRRTFYSISVVSIYTL